jgi:hypothetical protein
MRAETENKNRLVISKIFFLIKVKAEGLPKTGLLGTLAIIPHSPDFWKAR